MIFLCFTIAVVALMLSPLLPDRDLLTNFSGDLAPTYVYMTASYALFSLSYFAMSGQRVSSKRPTGVRQSINLPTVVKTRYIGLLACWAVFGTICSLWQIQATTGLSKYMELVNEGGASAEVARTSSIMLKASDGGLPGYIKMWNQNSTCAVLIVIFLLVERKRIEGLLAYFWVSLIACSFVVRNFVHMDRLALLAIIPAVLQLWLSGSKRTKKVVVLLLACIGALAQIQSLRRGHGFGSSEFLILYLQLGMFNNSLVMDTFSGSHTLGTSTLFSPLAWLAQGFGHPLSVYFQYSYVWDAAQDLFGYFYFDFGYYGIIVFGILGVGAKLLDSVNRRRKLGPDTWTHSSRTRLKPFVAYAALSSMFVPAFVGPEFWLTAVNIVGFCWLEARFGPYLFSTKLPKPLLLKNPAGEYSWPAAVSLETF